jgi:hypothetical protein
VAITKDFRPCLELLTEGRASAIDFQPSQLLLLLCKVVLASFLCPSLCSRRVSNWEASASCQDKFVGSHRAFLCRFSSTLVNLCHGSSRLAAVMLQR